MYSMPGFIPLLSPTLILLSCLLSCLLSTGLATSFQISSSQVSLISVARGNVERWHLASLTSTNATIVAVTQDAVYSVHVPLYCTECLDEEMQGSNGSSPTVEKLSSMAAHFATAGSFLLFNDYRLLTCSSNSANGQCMVCYQHLLRNSISLHHIPSAVSYTPPPVTTTSNHSHSLSTTDILASLDVFGR